MARNTTPNPESNLRDVNLQRSNELTDALRQNLRRRKQKPQSLAAIAAEKESSKSND